MKHFVVTSNHYQGELSFKFDLNDRLTGFQINATLSEEQYNWFFKNLPKTTKVLLNDWKANSKTIKITEVPLDLSFAAFYNKYAYKVGNKTKAKDLWNKLDDANKALAITKIDAYNRFIEQSQIAKVYPERYLSHRRYENEFK